MDPAKSLIARESSGLFPSAQQWQTMSQIADVLIKSGLLPQHVKTPQAALAIMLKGAELGVPAMQALSSIVVVQGKPTCNAELMLALVYRDQGDDAIIITQTTDQGCTVSYKRRGWKDRQSYSFTIEDAQRAGLADSQTWKKYPAAMLRARAISAVARMAFPDSIAGMYVYEEMGLPVDVEGGEQVVVSAPESAADAGTLEGDAGPALSVRASAPSPTVKAAIGGVRRGDPTPVGRADDGRHPVVEAEQSAAARPPSSAGSTAADWTQQQLGARVRELAGVTLQGLAHWQDLARTYGLPVPASGRDMTQDWLLGLYQAMQARLLEERIRQAPDEKALGEVMYGAYDLCQSGEIGQEQYQALDAQADARYGELAGLSPEKHDLDHEGVALAGDAAERAKELGRRISAARSEEEIAAVLKASQQAKDQGQITQDHRVGLLRLADTRRAALSGPLTANAV